MNVEHLQVTRDAIAAHHDQFSMAFWAQDADGDDEGLTDLMNECGSSGCIAGWAVAVAGEIVDPHTCAARAERLLGLTPDQGSVLFGTSGVLWGECPPDIEAKDAVDMLDRIIAGDVVL